MGETNEISAEITTKKCTKCGEVKALDAFSAHKQGSHGRRPCCKGCERNYRQKNKERIAAQKRKYYEKNKEAASVKGRNYRQENKERVAEYMRKYYMKNKESLAEYARKYRGENKELITEYMSKYGRKYRQENPEVHRRSSRKRRALKRFLPHSPLTPAQYERLYEFRDQVFGEVTS